MADIEIVDGAGGFEVKFRGSGELAELRAAGVTLVLSAERVAEKVAEILAREFVTGFMEEEEFQLQVRERTIELLAQRAVRG